MFGSRRLQDANSLHVNAALNSVLPAVYNFTKTHAERDNYGSKKRKSDRK